MAFRMPKEKLLLVGAGGFGGMVAEQVMLQYDCAFVDDGQFVGAEISGILVVGIGSSKLRAQVYEKTKVLGFVFSNIVASSTYISAYTKLGCNRRGLCLDLHQQRDPYRSYRRQFCLYRQQ